MHRHWAKFGPPAYVAVAAYLGLNKRGSSAAQALDTGELADFLAHLSGADRV